ncbi:MAG TPA: choloylglycine hydrolase [Ruminococcaceae bacterium]|nr:choloylglycine hydrolase [Oscillospiraceae bacterium]
MCTAASYKTENGGYYFGRTLDYEYSYGENVVFTPRNFAFSESVESGHYALLGTAHIEDGYPLYYDCVNEKGLAMAGLNFVGNAVYRENSPDKINLPSYEFIPFLLGKCKNLREARELLGKINLTNKPFSAKLPPSQLHWIITDKSGTIVVESVREGFFIYDNPVGVLANNPPFPQQLANLANYVNLTAKEPQNRFIPQVEIPLYSRGMGAVGLPGDLSSMSRFVRAAFVLNNSKLDDESNAVSQFFHILGAVEQQRGCCELADGKCEITIYTSCIDCARGIYCFTTYNNRRIRAVDMNKESLDGRKLHIFSMDGEEEIRYIN